MSFATSKLTRPSARWSAGEPAPHDEEAAEPAVADPLGLSGRTISHFRVVAPLGVGGMGVVYRAEDTRLGRPVALKFLLPVQRLDPAARERFLREARAAAALDHPNLCTVHEVGESADGWPFLAMTLYAGETLADRLRRDGALPAAAAVAIARQLARGLGCAHAAGIVHRDLKPGNVMLLPDGTATILDFGLAKSGDAGLTGSGIRPGTVAYMAPEQLFGEAVDARADLWALGVVMYEMLAGRRPFAGEHELSTAHAIVHDEPTWPPGPDVPAAVTAVVRRLVVKDLDRRYATAEAVLADLEELEDPEDPGGAALPRGARTLRGARARHTLGTALAGVLVVLLAAGAAGYAALTRSRATGGGTSATLDIRSLAVLPFADPSGDSAQAYFADGITEALTAELARVAGVAVTSPTSAMRYRHARGRAPAIARALHVDALVEGSVARDGDRVRVTARLVRAGDGRLVWSGAFARDLRDVLGLRGEIARAIAAHVRGGRTPAERAHLAAGSTRRRHLTDRGAYDLYLKGRYQYARYGQQAFRTAAGYFDGAIARDPAFAEAYAAKAFACTMTYALERLAPLAECEAAARRALALDETLPEAHAAVAQIRMWEWDWAAAEAEFRRALALDPSSVVALQWYAQLLRQTMRTDEALAVIRQAEALDPLDLYVRTQVGWVLFSQRRFEEALAQWNEVLALDPGYGLAIYNQGLVQVLRGRPREALAAAERAAPRLGDASLPITLLRALGHAAGGDRVRALRLVRAMEAADFDRSLVAGVHHLLGDDDAALALLEESFRRHDPFLPNTTSEPWFDGLRTHPRFRALRAWLGLADR